MAKDSESIDVINKVGENAEEAGKRIGNLMVRVGIDVSDALKGLKAVQREAKKAASALKEVEGLRNFSPVINITVNSNEEPEKINKDVKALIEKLNKEWKQTTTH